MAKTTKLSGNLVIKGQGISISNGTSYTDITAGTVNELNRLTELIDKNIECGLLLDWNVKVKDNSLARKLYPDHVIRNGWLYGKE